MMMVGADGLFRIRSLGVVTAAVAVSAGATGPAAKVSLSAERITRKVSFGASGTVAGSGFTDIAAVNGDPAPRLLFNAYTSISSRRWGSLGVVLAGVNQEASNVRDTLSPLLAQHTRILSASFSRQVGKNSLFITAFDNLSQTGNQGITVGLIVPFGRRSSVSVLASSSGEYGQVQAQRSAPSIRDLGYQVFASAGPVPHEFASVEYRAPSALLSLGVDSSGGQTTVRVQSEGALSAIDCGLFASNRIDDSFAVVDVRGLQHVRVMQEDRDVGVSNSSGRLLVPNLQSFSVNHISIEPTDVAPDVTIGVTQKEIRPPHRSGVVVRFDANLSYSALVRLVDEAGDFVPVGSFADHLGVLAPVGFDGDTYVQGLGADNLLLVKRPDGDLCRTRFSYHRIPGEIPTLGPFVCRKVSP